MRLSNSN